MIGSELAALCGLPSVALEEQRHENALIRLMVQRL